MPEKRAPYWRIVNLRNFLKQACFDVNFCNPLELNPVEALGIGCVNLSNDLIFSFY